MSDDTKQAIKDVYKLVLSCLIALNIFFIKRLVNEIDDTKQMVMSLRVEFAEVRSMLHKKRFKDAAYSQQKDRLQYDRGINETPNPVRSIAADTSLF